MKLSEASRTERGSAVSLSNVLRDVVAMGLALKGLASRTTSFGPSTSR